MLKTVIITGISGVLGSALGRFYLKDGWRVIGVGRKETADGDFYSEYFRNSQKSSEDAQKLLLHNPDLIILNAGQIETEIGEKGEPIIDQFESITNINYTFPAIFCMTANKHELKNNLDIVAIGSIADGSPSSFGPVYHASKIALHYFFSGAGPIIRNSNPKIRMRLYRPGAIKGPLAWAPVNRLNQRGYNLRKKRVDGAPVADKVAIHIARFIKRKALIGTYDEPFSFRLLKLLFAVFPNAYYKLQMLGWKKGSKFS
ncbi:MAG: SDR family oxidoreductase [Calditrichaeota bacterium]|nr:SDR family oxidoreductase [Calditrichota bacterium]